MLCLLSLLMRYVFGIQVDLQNQYPEYNKNEAKLDEEVRLVKIIKIFKVRKLGLFLSIE